MKKTVLSALSLCLALVLLLAAMAVLASCGNKEGDGGDGDSDSGPYDGDYYSAYGETTYYRLTGNKWALYTGDEKMYTGTFTAEGGAATFVSDPVDGNTISFTASLDGETIRIDGGAVWTKK